MVNETRTPSGYLDAAKKHPYYIKWVAVDRKTGEETPELSPKELPPEKRQEIIDRLAAGLGYRRIR